MPTYEEALAEEDIVSLDHISAHPNFLVFGSSGCGKTVLGGSDDKVLFIIIEAEGVLSAKRMGSKAHQKKIEKWTDVTEFLEKLKNWADTETGIPFNWIVFDSLTDAQNLLFDHINDEDGVLTEGWPQYRKNQKILLRTIKEFNALPVNMLWLALDRMEEDPDGEKFYCPEIHGKGYGVAMQVAAQMTSYGYMEVRTEKVPIIKDGKPVLDKDGEPRTGIKSNRIIWWQDIQKFKGKDRTLALAPITKNLTLKQIRQRVEKAFAGDEKKNTEEQSKEVTNG